MKNKTKGWLSLLLTLVVIAATIYIAGWGFGAKKVGSVNNIKLGLDLAGGVSVTYETVKENPTEQEMADTRNKMERRAKSYNQEASVYQEGNNRINIDIPDVEDANEVLNSLGSAGVIYFIYGQSEKDTAANVVFNSETMKYELARPIEEIIADGDVILGGTDIKDADPNMYQDERGMQQYVVSLLLNDAGTSKFAAATTYASGKTYGSAANMISIIYDNEVVSSPCVNDPILSGSAQITGMDDFDEASELATTIRIGALPIELTAIRAQLVGAQLGANALNASLLAGIIGFALVIIFMLVVYRVAGLAADMALVIYATLFVICLNLFETTLTLAGIAGVLLSVGMAVDANVIIFTRIKEEIATGKTVASSIKLGFDKALSAILDGNITTLIAAIVLYARGTGSIKSFAITLGMGVVISMFTAIFITRFIIKALFNIGFNKPGMYGKKPMKKAWDFIGHWKIYLAISGIVIVAGIVGMFVYKSKTGNILNYGLDFTGGTSTEVVFGEGKVPANEELETFVQNTLGITAEIVQVPEEYASIMKTSELTVDQQNTLTEAIKSTYGVAPGDITMESISGTVSGEMKVNAVWAVTLATILMLLYIWIRFRNVGFAVSSVIPLVHDVLVTLAVYALAKISVGNDMIACMLTLVGYSINATIVIFDRIREGLHEKTNKESYKDVINNAVTQTLSRSINTTITTLCMIAALVIFGGASIREFAVPLMVGLLSGGYSSVCIASAFLYLFMKKKDKTATAPVKGE